jgi:hypothetical protein
MTVMQERMTMKIPRAYINRKRLWLRRSRQERTGENRNVNDIVEQNGPKIAGKGRKWPLRPFNGDPAKQFTSYGCGVKKGREFDDENEQDLKQRCRRLRTLSDRERMTVMQERMAMKTTRASMNRKRLWSRRSRQERTNEKRMSVALTDLDYWRALNETMPDAECMSGSLSGSSSDENKENEAAYAMLNLTSEPTKADVKEKKKSTSKKVRFN